MAKHWALGVILLSCVLLGRGEDTPCGNQMLCVPEDRCRIQMGEVSNVCCDIKQVIPLVEKTSGGETTTAPEADAQCGRSNPNGLDENFNGSDDQAKFGEFPWTIALFHDTQYFGGGSLVAQDVVLIAAHLLADKSEAGIVVRAGDWDLTSTTESYPYEERKVSKIVKHQGFNVNNGANNLALLFLETPFPKASHISPICLASAERSIDGRCLVAGWGKKAYPDEQYSNILKKIDLPIVDRATCQDMLRKTRLGSSFVLDPSFVCAGGEKNKDACKGDGGSAMFCPLANDASRYEQVGIVNWGIKCGRENVPATYTNVAMFYPWIEQQLNGQRN